MRSSDEQDAGSKKAGGAPGNHPWIAIIAACLMFLWTFLEHTAGFEQMVYPHSFDLFNRFFANAYPHCIGDPSLGCFLAWDRSEPSLTESQEKKVSVILWNDDILKRTEMVWPIRMEDHAQVLETLLAYKPKAVLVDIMFLDNPQRRGDESLGDLVDIVREYRDGNTGIYFVEPDGIRITETLRKEIGEENILLPTLKDRDKSRTYLSGSAASAIFQKYSSVEVDGDFYLFWPGHSDPSFKQFAFDCRETTDSNTSDRGFPVKITSRQFLFATHAITGDPSRHENSHCPYIPTVPADIVHCLPPDPGISSARAAECMGAVGLRADVSDVKDILEGKYVIYGSGFVGEIDSVSTPISGRLPAVYVHAMALDNLLETNGAVHIRSDHILGRKMIRSLFEVAVFVCLIVAYALMLSNVWEWGTRRLDSKVTKKIRTSRLYALGKLSAHLFYDVILIYICCIFLLLISWAVYLASYSNSWLRFGVLNLIIILLFATIMALIDKWSSVRTLLAECFGTSKADKALKAAHADEPTD